MPTRPHINDAGEFQSDKYPTCPPGKVPLSVKDLTAQDLLWQYAQRRRAVDAEFAEDLEAALISAGYAPPKVLRGREELAATAQSMVDTTVLPAGFRAVAVVTDVSGAFLGVGRNTSDEDTDAILRCALSGEDRIDYVRGPSEVVQIRKPGVGFRPPEEP